MSAPAFLTQARRRFHRAILESLLTLDGKGVPSNADSNSKSSSRLARGIYDAIGIDSPGVRLPGQSAGNLFEELCLQFIQEVFLELGHMRPGEWTCQRVDGRRATALARFEQYAHLQELAEAVNRNKELSAILGSDYIISPDLVVFREPEPDDFINKVKHIVDGESGRRSPIRLANSPRPILHASISCKWTMRSDRAQNARSEAVNLIKNRKGHLPHVMVVTGEPAPNRIASLALGTGEIDCVYHFALPEMRASAEAMDLEDAKELIDTMVEGNRLRDIADLPLDLAV